MGDRGSSQWGVRLNAAQKPILMTPGVGHSGSQLNNLFITVIWILKCVQPLIIIIYFSNVHFFHAQLGLDVLPDMRPVHISLHIAHSKLQIKLIYIILHTIPIFHILYSHLSPCHHHISKAPNQWPIISTLTFHMPKPPQSTMPHHLSHALNPKNCSRPHFVSYPSEKHHTSRTDKIIHNSQIKLYHFNILKNSLECHLLL